MRRLFLLIYGLSGAAGLIYEILWTRQLTLLMGHTTAAVSAVLAAFMGGLAIGAAAGGRAAPQVSEQAERSGSYREDDVVLFDTRVEKRFRADGISQGNTLALFFATRSTSTNTNTSESNDTTVGRRTVTVDGELVNYQRFLRPTGTMPPRVYRVGVKYSF
jgi:hypothetical protein